jgi:large subunit ribosomal protein L35
VPKIRTSRTAAKRFKITGTGKLIRRFSHQNHREHKTDTGRRRLDREQEVVGKRRVTFKRMMGGK